METKICEMCRGEGIIGNGDQPWLRQGDLKTCPGCTGTGKVETSTEEIVTPDTTDGVEADTDPKVTEDSSEIQPTESSSDSDTTDVNTQDAPVDNVDVSG